MESFSPDPNFFARPFGADGLENPQTSIAQFKAQFHVEPVAYEMADRYYYRMRDLSLDDDQAETKAGVIYEFSQIGGRLLLAEPGLAGPEGEILLPLNVNLAKQILWLLAEGIFYVAMQCHYRKIEWDVEKNLHETIAQELFDQAKNMVIATHDDLPEVGEPMTGDQKVALIVQTAKNALSYWLSVHQDTMETSLPPKEEAEEHLSQLHEEARKEIAREISKEQESLALGSVSQEWFVHWVRIWRYLNEKTSSYQPVSRILEDQSLVFRPEHLAQDISAIYQERLFEGMMKHDLSELEMESVAQYLYEYVVVGGQSLVDTLAQGGQSHQEIATLYIAEDEAPVCLNRQMVRLTLLMYAEGIYQSLLKSYQMAVAAPLREQMIRGVSYDLYVNTLRQLRRFQVQWFNRVDMTQPLADSGEKKQAQSDFMLLVLRHLMSQQEMAEGVFRQALNKTLIRGLGGS